MRDARERLRDILEAIEHIERYAAKGQDAFESDELIQSWFVRHILVHDYFGINTGVVWGVVERELPVLKRQVQTLLHNLGN